MTSPAALRLVMYWYSGYFWALTEPNASQIPKKLTWSLTRNKRDGFKGAYTAMLYQNLSVRWKAPARTATRPTQILRLRS